VRHSLLVGSIAALVIGAGAPLTAQISFDARRDAMAGLPLFGDGSLSRYNAAFRAVPKPSGHAFLTIPIPLGILQALKDSTAFDTDSSYFNPVELANLILHPPIFLEVKKAPTPTNNVEFDIGQNAFRVNLGQSAGLVPTDQFGFGASARLLDIGFGAKGVRIGAMVWLNYDVGFVLGDSLRQFLADSAPAHTNTNYNVLEEALAQGGVAPQIGWAGKLTGTDSSGLYLGVNARYYLGLGYARMQGNTGFTTGDTLFAGSNPVTPSVAANFDRATLKDGMGHGFGGDIGLAYVSGPLQVGLGINDVGATITWPKAKIDTFYYDTTTQNVQHFTVDSGVETKTKIPVSYLLNGTYTLPTGTTVGAAILDNGRGTTVHIGGEQRVGPLAVRAGIERDERHKIEFGWGGGLRFLFLSLDVGFVTHSSSLSNSRGVTMATSISIY